VAVLCCHSGAGHGDDVDLTRSWMLPVFRDHIQDTQIAFFADYFLPLASRLKLKCKIFVVIKTIIVPLKFRLKQASYKLKDMSFVGFVSFMLLTVCVAVVMLFCVMR